MATAVQAQGPGENNNMKPWKADIPHCKYVRLYLATRGPPLSPLQESASLCPAHIWCSGLMVIVRKTSLQLETSGISTFCKVLTKPRVSFPFACPCRRNAFAPVLCVVSVTYAWAKKFTFAVSDSEYLRFSVFPNPATVTRWVKSQNPSRMLGTWRSRASALWNKIWGLGALKV